MQHQPRGTERRRTEHIHVTLIKAIAQSTNDTKQQLFTAYVTRRKQRETIGCVRPRLERFTWENCHKYQ